MIPQPPPKYLSLGTEWLQQLPTTTGFRPNFAGPVQEVHARIVGNQGVVQWLYAEIQPQHQGTGTAPSQEARNWVRSLGKPGDDAGHVVAKELGGRGDVWWNIFPQSRNFNRGAYNHNVEAMLRSVSQGTIRVWYHFLFGDPGLPLRATQLLFLIILPGGAARNDEVLNP